MADYTTEEIAKAVMELEDQILERASLSNKPTFEELTPRGAILRSLKREPSWVIRRKEVVEDRGKLHNR